MAADASAAFFSYSREDSEFALRLATDLKDAGAAVWIDQLDIEPGMRWDRAVETALNNCPRMLVILSPVSVESDNVRDEISFALRKQKTIIPVLYLDCDIPLRLERHQHIDFRTDHTRGLKLLLKALGVEQPLLPVASPPPEIQTLGQPDISAATAPQRAMVQERPKEREQAAEQARLEEERKRAQQIRLEQERYLVEPARLEEERRRTAARKARLKKMAAMWPRVSIIVAAVICIVCASGFFISFIGNRSLESTVRTAIDDVQPIQEPTAHQLASQADLQKLDRLRRELATLAAYRKDGAPLRLRWGLYIGDRIYPNASRVYFEHFQQLLFAETQARLLSDLRAKPVEPSQIDNYGRIYDELKAYLITTIDNDKSTAEFLTPVLLDRWRAGRVIDPDRVRLATQQFDFYSTELAVANPFSSAADSDAIERARSYLLAFPGGIGRSYLPLLEEASRKNPDVNFNQQFPDARGVIESSYTVGGAFTRRGYAFMQGAIRNSSPSIFREEWVLGRVAAVGHDDPTQSKLTERYRQDFIDQWRAVLQKSTVTPYVSLADADKKLDQLTSPSSPLLELLWFVSNNTNVEDSDVSSIFLPVQAVVPPGSLDKLPDQYVLPSNASYIAALVDLQSDIETINRRPASAVSNNLIEQALGSARSARVLVTRMVLLVDPRFHTENEVRRLLVEPITNAESLLVLHH